MKPIKSKILPQATVMTWKKELEAKWEKREPWVVIDPDFKREWLAETPLQYYLHQDKKTGEWSVCDRWLDIEFTPKIRSKNKSVVIRRFFKLINRPIPVGEKLGKKIN